MNNKPSRKSVRVPSRLSRIERKCDWILSELIIFRRRGACRPDDVDTAIDRLRRAARKLREQSRRESGIARNMLHPKMPE